MKKLSFISVVLVILAIFSISGVTTSAFAWDGSTHSFIVNYKLDRGWLCSRWARIGASTPDFAWYLLDFGHINNDQAEVLHYELLDSVNGWNFLHGCFEYGVWTHLCADQIADKTVEAWITFFLALLESEGQNDPACSEVLHLAFEFAVGSLVVDKYGLQSADLIFLYWPANFVEKVVKNALGYYPGFDVSGEFIKYMTIQRILDKLAKAYAPYLKGDIGEEFLEQVDISELLSGSSELPYESLSSYFRVLEILLAYPAEIYETITNHPNWENVMEDEVFEQCIKP
jgi:hypothetical protein